MSNPDQPTSPRTSAPEVKPGKAAKGGPAKGTAEYPFDEGMEGFWQKNGQAIIIFFGIILLGYLGKEAWGYFSREREAGVQQEYAAATTPEGWRSFVDAHPDHALAGVMDVRLGDAAYASGRLDEAIVNYGRAADLLKGGPLGARARLGLGMAKVQAGQITDGEGILHDLADDKNGYKAIRAEATYQLASLSAAAGLYADVRKYSTQILQIDPNSPWAQRAFSLPTAPPVEAAAAPAPAAASNANSPTPPVSFKTPPAK